MVLGLEEHLEGTFLNHINDLGYAAVGFEGGQNESPATIGAHEEGIWRALVAIGSLDAADVPAIPRSNAAPGGRKPPGVVEIRYLHTIHPGEEFVMSPGFENLTKVRQGDLLAHDRHGEIRSLENGFVLMPLYQPQGSDGFFLVRPVRPFWLRVSSVLRALRLGKRCHIFPACDAAVQANSSSTPASPVGLWLKCFTCSVTAENGPKKDGRSSPAAAKFHDKPCAPNIGDVDEIEYR